MKKLVLLLCSILLLVSCKEQYKMPNYFRHHENGNVKQITINTFDVVNGLTTLSPENFIILWGEAADGISTYDKNGNILSDKFYNYNYNKDGRLESTTTKNVGANGQLYTQDYIYNDHNEIQSWGGFTFAYDGNNQIYKIIEDQKSFNYYPASHREYEYNNDGQMKSCNISNTSTTYNNYYNENGELQQQIVRLGALNSREYNISITQRDEKGNWTERRIITPTNEYIQKREIVYY